MTVLLVLMWPISAATPSFGCLSLRKNQLMELRLTWAAFDIVECKLGHARVEFHQQGQRLADTASTAEDGDFRCL